MILTKGDNSPIDDVVLYPKGQEYVRREQVVGLVRQYVPYLGWISILLKEAPLFKFALLIALAFASYLG